MTASEPSEPNVRMRSLSFSLERDLETAGRVFLGQVLLGAGAVVK